MTKRNPAVTFDCGVYYIFYSLLGEIAFHFP